MRLYDWQQKDVDEWFKSGGIGLNASETGAGKTMTALGAIKKTGESIALIVGPKSTYRSWNESSQRFLGVEVKNIDTTKKGKSFFSELSFGEPGIYFIGTELFRTFDWQNTNVGVAVVDEVHKLSTYDTVGSKALHKFQPRYKLALSATPVRNNLKNMWSLLRWLYPEMEHWQYDDAYVAKRNLKGDELTKFVTREVVSEFTLKSGRVVKRKADRRFPLNTCNPKYFWQFNELYFKLARNFFRGNLEVTGEQFEGEVISRLPNYVRHLKRSYCCPAHPNGFADWDEPVERRVYLPMTAKQKKFYNELEMKQVAWLEERPLVAQLSITQRLRKAEIALGEMVMDEETESPYFEDNCRSAKLDWVQEQMEEGVLEGEQFICFTHSRKFASVAAKRLNAFEWSGAVDQKERDKAAEAFVSGELRVIVAVIAAAGTGTDFMQKCSNAVWFSETTDGTDNTQARGRLDRRGQVKGVTDWLLLSEGTEEAGWMSDRMKKQLQLRNALDK